MARPPARPRLVTRRWLRLFLVLSLLGTTGAQWAGLQLFAWASMRVQGISLDGRHECGMCMKARAGARSQQKQEARVQAPKASLIASTFSMPAPRPIECASVLPSLRGRISIPQSAEPPPPRSAA